MPDGPATDGRKEVAEMIAESLREGGLLLLVFGWLDTMFRYWGGQSVNPFLLIAVSVVSLAMIVFGVWLERSRE
jgi:hypothetical protein